MNDRWYRTLAGAAAVYLALLPTQLLSFWRSAAFAVAVLAAAGLAWRQRRGAVRALAPGRITDGWSSALPVALVLWLAWLGATAFWSVDRQQTLNAFRSDLAWGLLTALVCFTASAAHPAGFRILAGSLLAGIAFWASLAAGLALSTAGWDARAAHWALGVYTTWLVTIAPFLLMLGWPPPEGFARPPASLAVAAVLVALVAGTAYLANTRAVWLAFAAALLPLLAGGTREAAPRARVGAAALLAASLAMAAWTIADRSQTFAGVAGAGANPGELASDPRLLIWKGAWSSILERPLLGHGYGLQIMAADMRTVSADPLITHPHNLFLGQWLQSGAIGLALFVLVILLLAGSYVRMLRSGDRWIARLGTLGLMVLAGFIVRNLTDDFFLRANARLLFGVHGMLLGAAHLRRRQQGAGR